VSDLPEMPGMDFGKLLEQAQQMQQQLMDAQAAVAEQVVEGQAGGGVVKISVTGGWEFKAVHIDPSAVDPDDVEMLEDLVLAALHEAVARVQELSQQGMGGLDLGGLGGLLGGGTP
jgi:nucleoid-associated protein EbfC